MFEKNIIRKTREGQQATQGVGILIDEGVGQVDLAGNTIEAEKEIGDRRPVGN